MRRVDTAEYVSMLRQLVEEGHEVSLVIAGGSMLPFLVHQRDTIYFQKPHRELKAGDMVFYQRDNGQFVMHRIHAIRDYGYYMVGDAQQDIEGPLRREQIFGLITKVKRKGKILGPGSFWWEFFEHVWPRVLPVRHRILGLYSSVRKGGSHGK